MSRTIKKLLQWLEVELGRKVRPAGGSAVLELLATMALMLAVFLIPRNAMSLVPSPTEEAGAPVVSPPPEIPGHDRTPAGEAVEDRSIYCQGLIRPPLPVPEYTPRDCKPRPFEMIPFTDSRRIDARRSSA